jgi:hypothetical protein
MNMLAQQMSHTPFVQLHSTMSVMYLLDKGIANSSSSRYSGSAHLPSIEHAIRAIPEDWESIAKTELRCAGSLKPHELLFLLEQDVHYCISAEQDIYYRELLHVVRLRPNL